MFDHALSLLGVYCLVIHPICKFLQQTAKKILAYPTVNRQKNSTGVSARFSNYGLYLYLYLWRIACQGALVSIVVEPTSPSLWFKISSHKCVHWVNRTRTWLLDWIWSRDDQFTKHWLCLLFQWRRSAELEEERVSPSKTSRRRTSRETWETSAMVTIIHCTFANLKLTQSCILAFVGERFFVF